MGPKKSRRVREIEVPTDSIPEFELGDTTTDIQCRREREKQEKGRKGTETEGGGQEGAGKKWRNTLARGGSCRKKGKDIQSDTETEAGGEAGTSQSRYKNGHMTNIYLTDSDKEAIVDFVKDHKEICDKTNEHFKDKTRKECL